MVHTRNIIRLVFLLTGILVCQWLQPVYAQKQADTTVVDIDAIPAGKSNNIGTGVPGQNDASDSVIVVEEDRNRAPRKAALLAAVFPGFGQIYNGKYWKVPIIYAGFAGIAYAVVWNNDKYQLYKRVLLARSVNATAEDPLNGILGTIDPTRLQSTVENYNRDRDLSIIIMVALYGLQIMDAIVDAHLMDFDTDTDLSFELKPSGGAGGVGDGYSVPNYGLALTLKFQ